MKICSQCRAQFEDDMNFCLQDGTPLVEIQQFSDPAENYREKTLNLPTVPNVPPTVAPTQGFYPPVNQPQSIQPTVELNNQPTVSPKMETSPVLASLTANSQDSKSRSSLMVASLAGILVLLGTAIGGVWWFSQTGKNTDLALANTSQNSATPANKNSNQGFSNGTASTSSDNQAETSSKSNSGDNTKPSFSNSAELTKPTPTKEIEDKPTPKPVVSEEKEPTPDKTQAATPKPVPKTISAGVLNGKATYLAKPEYPAAARAVRAGGAVNVQVTIDESGNVISASAVSGHPLLRSSAVSAARSSRFTPTMLSGQAVKVTGVIVYNFVP